MRVGLIFEYPTVNGGENSMLAVAAHLAETESTAIEFHAFAPSAGDLPRRLDEMCVDRSPWEVTRNGSRRTRAALLTELVTLASSCQLDVLHANSLSMARLTGAASSGFPCRTSAHVRDILRLSHAAVRDLNCNSRLIAVSEATRQFHVRQGVDSERIVTVHNGINADRFAGSGLPPAEKDSPSARRRVQRAVRLELGIPENSFVILSVGQIGLRKGLDTLAEAVVRLAGRTADAEPPEEVRPVHLVLAGARYSTKPESIEYEQQVVMRLRDAAPRITSHLVGYRRDIPRLMHAADILVHAARQEPLGRVLIEAGAVGLPVVATRAGGTSEIYQDDRSAVLVPVDRPEQLAQAISRYRKQPAFRSRIAGCAEQTIRHRFGIGQSAARLMGHWREISQTEPQS